MERRRVDDIVTFCDGQTKKSKRNKNERRATGNQRLAVYASYAQFLELQNLFWKIEAKAK